MSIKEYKELEKRLAHKYKNVRENEAVLGAEHFKNGKLTAAGYEDLKLQCEYIPYREKIEIAVPKTCADGFKTTLEAFGARELSRIQKDRREAMIVSLFLLAGGILWLVLGYFFDASSKFGIVRELVIIVSWVFVWAAVEKFFFDRRRLTDRRFSLLQILSAEIICV